MDYFEKYVREMVAKMEIVNDIVQETGKLNGEATKLLMTKAIEPYGLWKAGNQEQSRYTNQGMFLIPWHRYKSTNQKF